ncbi:MAG TPA: ABC transporter permease [Candidatus Eisenbacteria bacterium]|jgi:predicted permease|nr:ABC transporter permease [Candidatus Eisenbacteria bacterium]
MSDAMRTMWAKARAVLGKSREEEEFSEELAAHVDLLAAENEKAGMNPAEARRAANLRVGGRETLREMHREERGLPFLEVLGQDLRYAVRTLRRDAGFFFAAVAIMGLGIGASCTIFSVVNTLLIRPLPFKDPARLAWIANHEDGTGDLSGMTSQVDHFLDLRAQNKSFEDMAAYMAFYGVGDAKLIGDGEPERFTSVPVSQNFFPLLGVEPQLGRQFSADECKWNGPRVTMLSDGVWRRKFGADPKIIGRALPFDGGPVTVVGVLPASFDFATVFAAGSRIDIFQPFPLSPETNRWGNTLSIVGRLKPGVSVQSAQAEVTLLAALDRQTHKDRNDFEPKVSALPEHVSGRLRPALLLLVSAVGVVMLIVCANLSNLLLARGTTRQKEIAIRAALGAGKARLMGQMLTESVLLSITGALTGLLMAFAGTRVLAHLTAVSIPLLAEVRIDGSVLGFALLVAVATGLIFGLAPALQVPRFALSDTLKDSSRGSSQGRARGWVRSALVVSEIALACVLLAGAGLLIRSFLRVLDVDLGFRPERAAAVRIDPSSGYKTQEQRNAYFNDALHRVLDVPGIEAAGLSDCLPLGRNRGWGIAAKGVVYTPQTYPDGFPRIVSDGYFRAMGVKLVEGRDISERDTKGTLPVIVINETLARNLWPGQDPLGRIVNSDVERTVVGVVGDVRHIALEKESGNEFYIPIRQIEDYSTVDLVVRSSLPTAELSSRLREALRPIEPNLPVKELRTLETLVDRAVSPRRFVVVLLGGFAVFALGLALIGVYAVISYSVNQRQLEIGIRMALGASPGLVQRMVLGETMRMAAAGVAIGLVGGLALTRLASSLLYGVTASDPLTFAAVVVILTGVAGLAGFVPAWRAARIEPMSALRTD